jgi:hypothetical protein
MRIAIARIRIVNARVEHEHEGDRAVEFHANRVCGKMADAFEDFAREIALAGIRWE